MNTSLRSILRCRSCIKDSQSKSSNTAKLWGGGKPELTAVAQAYLTGAPLNGDVGAEGTYHHR